LLRGAKIAEKEGASQGKGKIAL